MEFSRPEYWRGEPFPSPGDLPNLGIDSRSPALRADLYQLSPKDEDGAKNGADQAAGLFPAVEAVAPGAQEVS